MEILYSLASKMHRSNSEDRTQVVGPKTRIYITDPKTVHLRSCAVSNN